MPPQTADLHTESVTTASRAVKPTCRRGARRIRRAAHDARQLHCSTAGARTTSQNGTSCRPTSTAALTAESRSSAIRVSRTIPSRCAHCRGRAKRSTGQGRRAAARSARSSPTSASASRAAASTATTADPLQALIRRARRNPAHLHQAQPANPQARNRPLRRAARQATSRAQPSGPPRRQADARRICTETIRDSVSAEIRNGLSPPIRHLHHGAGRSPTASRPVGGAA